MQSHLLHGRYRLFTLQFPERENSSARIIEMGKPKKATRNDLGDVFRKCKCRFSDLIHYIFGTDCSRSNTSSREICLPPSAIDIVKVVGSLTYPALPFSTYST